MAGGNITLTREGYNKLQAKLTKLKGEVRMQIADDLAKARALGDLSENAEYDAARNAQVMNEKQIAELEDTLTRAKIIDDSRMAKDEARLGAFVKVKDEKSGDEIEYMLVAEEESDFDQDKISVTSPVGRALLGHKVGDIVEVDVPAGKLVYEITGIRR